MHLSPRECDPLAQLLLGAGRVMTHGQRLRAVSGEAQVEDVQRLRIFIGRLRLSGTR